MLYTRPEGACTHRDAIRDIIIAGGVRRCTTRLIGTSFSRLNACAAVRGKPSRINEAEGHVDAAGGGRP